MSILKKPYEISVWVDELEDGKYVEKRLGIIGTHTMTAQNRAIKPNLSRNVNGVKKLSFSMYKRFIDNITGEWVENPFSEWLVNERKVKLKYGKTPEGSDRWYDFIIKDVSENSTDYLFTYQLEDALVQELSKNGFGVVLDEKIRDESGRSNMGTTKELAEKVLAETDWAVDSEVFVQTVEEALVYIKIPANTSVKRIIDPRNSTTGITPQETSIGGEALAFYSCCKNKPYRFQFIYLSNGYGDKKNKISCDENKIINIQDCQYYYDVFANNKKYVEVDGYYLPEGWQLIRKGEQGIDDTYDTTVSNWYRGARYGFAQDAEYVPLLDRYCNKFYVKSSEANHDYSNDEEIYGFIHNEYNSPTLVQNVITNTEFKSTAGWVGTYSGRTPNAKQNYGVVVEPAYGRFVGKDFSSVIKELQEGSYNVNNKYVSYLKITVPARTSLDTPILVNTGFYDNRTLIDSVGYNEKWVLNYKILDSTGTPVSGFDFKLREVKYDIDNGDYNLNNIWAEQQGNFLQFNDANHKTDGYADVKISSTDFKKKEIKLVITPPSVAATYYLEVIELYKAIPKTVGGTDYIVPGKLEDEGVITTTYNFFTQEALNAAEEEQDIVFDKKTENEWYRSYVPKFNTGAEKVRSVTAKESNYFNILQQIAETFEAWLHLEVERDEEGGITKKWARFKKYAGNENYAAFRYGVNLKNIQRTHASKNIVTKLIVKQNANEHAKNGFCTIQRASSNPTGENYIYDFRHFHDEELMDAKDYVSLVYGNSGAKGPDLGNTEADCNLINYNSRIKKLNDDIISLNDDIIAYQTDLTKLNAEKTVEDNLIKAGESELEKTREDFELLTGLSIENISPSDFNDITITPVDEKPGIEITTNYEWADGAQVTYIKKSITDWIFKATLPETQLDNSGLSTKIENYPKESNKVEWSNGTLKLTKESSVASDQYLGLRVNLTNGYQVGTRYRLSFVISNINGTLNKIGGHNASFTNPTIKIWYGDSRYKLGPDTQISNNSVLAVEPGKTNYYVEFEGTYCKNSNDDTPAWFIQPNRYGYDSVTCNITNIKIQQYEKNLSTRPRTLNFTVNFKLTPKLGEVSIQTKKLSCSIPAYSTEGILNYTFSVVDLENSKVSSLLTEYATLRAQIDSSNNKLQGTSGLNSAITAKENAIKGKEQQRDTLLNHKKILNKLFYTRFSRFIQEGTWVSEEYVDDDKYYNDALSVIYNSCRPQVAYTINVIELSAIPGYEMFTYELGDRTYMVDPDFFGNEEPHGVTISEINENLDDPNQNTIKVQNYKNQFKDLFQKITATVQQTQYSTGAYEKAVALAEASAEVKGDFLQSALDRATAKLTVGGQDTVVQDDSGITITNSVTKDQMRLVGGAILLSSQNEETGERTWKTGLTPEGISASLITAGTINAGDISIMNVNEPVFRWDSFGLSAFDAEWGGSGIVGRPNKNKFVRFDKHGIYGISDGNEVAIDGLSWKPSSIDEITEKATFALTWDGLKVSSEKADLRIGNGAKGSGEDTNLLQVTDKNGREIFFVTEDGSFLWSNESSPTKVLYARTNLGKPTLAYDKYNDSNKKDENGKPITDVWHKIQSEDDWFASYSYDGGNAWSDPSQIQSASTKAVIEWYYATSSQTEQPKRPDQDSSYEGKWKPAPTGEGGAGHSAVNKYLWNYEQTDLTNNISVYSIPALIATQPKNISKIFEFYTVTTSSTVPNKPYDFKWDGTDLTYTNEPNKDGIPVTTSVWDMVDISKQEASKKVVNQSEYLWNFEVICYDDNSCEVISIANIGTGGRGIQTVTNWYQATATEALKPNTQDGGKTDSSWKKTISETGHGADAPFLWTYEETEYSAGDPEKTPITLLTRTPRTIESITEYYYCKVGDLISSEKPSYKTGTNNNEVVIPEGIWSDTMLTPGEGQSLWNFELIKFKTKDDNGQNLYQIVEPARIGYIGIDSYTLSLDNDNDTIVVDNTGKLISTLPTITPSCYIGNVKQTINDDWLKIYNLSLDAPDDWKNCYEFSSSTGVLKLTKVPNAWSNVEFKIIWKKENSILDTETFSAKKILSSVDYDLVVSQVVYNSSQEGKTITNTITVQRKDKDGTTTLSTRGSNSNDSLNEPIYIYQDSIDTANRIKNWGGSKEVEFGKDNTTPIKLILTSADGSIVWDEEVIEFTKDGSSLICVTLNSPLNKTKANWQKWTGSQNLTLESVENLRIGNSIYFVDTISDETVDGINPTPVTVYATITAIDKNKTQVTVTINSVVFGASKGSDANVTLNNIWSAFAADVAAAKKKGLYTEGDYWAVNADILQSGAIRIGDELKEGQNAWENAKFYAGMDNDKVYIAGWEVDTSILKRGEEFSANSIFLSPEGIEASVSRIDFNPSKNEEDQLIAIGINNNLKISKGGTIESITTLIDKRKKANGTIEEVDVPILMDIKNGVQSLYRRRTSSPTTNWFHDYVDSIHVPPFSASVVGPEHFATGFTARINANGYLGCLTPLTADYGRGVLLRGRWRLEDLEASPVEGLGWCYPNLTYKIEAGAVSIENPSVDVEKNFLTQLQNPMSELKNIYGSLNSNAVSIEIDPEVRCKKLYVYTDPYAEDDSRYTRVDVASALDDLYSKCDNTSGLQEINNKIGEGFSSTNTIGSKIDDLDDRLSALGFKEPCDIIYPTDGTTVVGKVYQLGTLVYGYIDTFSVRAPYKKDEGFRVGDGRIGENQIPGPAKDQYLTIPIYSTAKGGNVNYTSGTEIGSAMAQLHISKSGDGGVYFTIEKLNWADVPCTSKPVGGNEWAVRDDWIPNWTYFCYSTDEDHHPES